MTKRIVIDAGHGGNDSGTVNNGIIEKDYALDISKYISNRLTELGIENKLSRTTDELLDQTIRPKRIQSFYGKGNDVVVISNHLNAGGGDGAEVIYALRNTDKLSKLISKELENTGQNVRKYYQRRLPSNPSKDYYYIMRDTPNNETVIVEYGFTDSTGDDVSLIKNNWQNLAEAVVKALATYVGVSYSSPEVETNVSNNIYIVKKGDTLWSIAKKYNTTVDKLKSINNLSTNNLSIGQKLVTDIVLSDYYIVKKGDTLFQIAKNFNTSVQKLKDINNLSSDFLSINQKLVVPNSQNIYVVKSGDTLYSIANKYNTTVDNIKNKNNLNSNIINIGQELII